MPPKRSVARKPRQTRLAFSSVPPSSPRAAALSPQLRSRAAAVTLQESPGRPSKRRKIALGKGKERAVNDSDSDDELGAVVGATYVRVATEQADNQTEDHHGIPTPKKSFRSNPYSPDQADVTKSMRLGLPVSTKPHGMFGDSDVEGGVSTDASSSTAGHESGAIKTTPKKQSKKKKKKKKKGKTPILDDSEEHQPDPSPVRYIRRERVITSSGSDSEIIQPKTRRQLRSNKKAQDDQAETDSVLGHLTEGTSSSSESDAMPDVTPAIRVRRTATRRQRANSFEVEDDVVDEEEDEEEEEVVAPRSTRRKVNTRAVSQSEEEESEEEQSTKKRRAGNDPERDRREQEELEDDLEFLRSSPPADKGRLRSTNGRPLNKRQKALEELKRRRTSSAAAPSSSGTSRRRPAVIPSDSDSDLDIINEENEKGDQSDDMEPGNSSEVSDIEGDDEQMGSDNDTNAHDVFQENDEDAGFIDDDDNALIGAPADHTNIPIEFTSLSSAKPRELFKYAVEWMVQKKLNPAFNATDEIYKLAFDKLNDEVAGLANSKYSSSVWTPDFTRALRARPVADFSEIGQAIRVLEDAHCEACNRKTHPASWNVSFSELPYNKHTLEPLEDDDDDEEEDDDDDNSDSPLSSISSLGQNNRTRTRHTPYEKPTRDVNGEIIPPTTRIFTLGSTCKANAQMAHTLHHWRYHLNSWVVDYLARTGHCTPEKLVKRDRWSVKKRGKYANKVVDEMERSGEIRKLHRLYKDQVDYAVEAKNEYRSGWGRRG